MSKQKKRRFNVAMRNIQAARKDVADVLSVVDYDFDQAKRHEETLEAYNRRSAISALSDNCLPRLAGHLCLSHPSRYLTMK